MNELFEKDPIEKSHRENSKVIINNLPEDTSKSIILTGDRPTGKLHLGHYVGSLKQRLEAQHRVTQYILIADIQALTDNFSNPKKVHDNVLQVMLDYLSVGIEPEISTIYIASGIPETAELTLYFLNLINIGRLSRNPTIKTEIKQRGFGEEIPAGFFVYPVNQAADIAQFSTDIVPVGEDQIPMIEVTNDITKSFNSIYKTNLFRKCSAYVKSGGLLPGIDGSSKMSKSLNNCIYLSDSPKDISEKVKKMYTDPNHLKVEDPGNIEGNTVFTYLDFFDQDKNGLEDLKNNYRAGGIGDGIVKKRLDTILQDLLAPMRTKREFFEKDPAEIINMLKKGTLKAREKSAETLAAARKAIGLNY